MLNQSVFVGRIKELDIDNGIVLVAITRSYKNKNGEYDTDLIPVTIQGSMKDNTFEYCSVGDIIGVKGRLQNEDDNIKVYAEKISFLSSGKKTDEDENEEYFNDDENED